MGGIEDEKLYKHNAAGALFLFIFTFASSIIFLNYDKRKKEQFDLVGGDEHHSLLPRGMSDYNVESDSELELNDIHGDGSFSHHSADDNNIPITDLPPIS